jgi:hypothetical protein
MPHGQGRSRPQDDLDGKLIAEGDTVFVFASENKGGQGLIARGIFLTECICR